MMQHQVLLHTTPGDAVVQQPGHCAARGMVVCSVAGSDGTAAHLAALCSSGSGVMLHLEVLAPQLEER